MSLTDIDKNDSQRRNPLPNTVDVVNNRMAHNTYGNTNRRSGGTIKPRMVFKQAGIMTLDENDKVSSVYMYIPELSPIPVIIVAGNDFDVFVDVLKGEIERPEV